MTARTPRHTRPALAMAIGLLALTALAAPSRATYFAYGELSVEIDGVGTVAGTDYEPYVTDDSIDLDGMPLHVTVDVGQFCSAIETLPDGNTYTLLSTTGDLTGEFAGLHGPVQDGDTVGVVDRWRVCFRQPRGELEIHYHRSGPVKTVTGTVVNGSPIPVSHVVLDISPDAPQTNEPTTLTATVTTSSGAAQGTIAFQRYDAVFPALGCAQQPLVHVGGAYVATCTIQPAPSVPIFSPHAGPNVTATFTPDDPAQMRDATGGQLIWVAAGRTATQLAPAPDTTPSDRSLHVTATVVPALAGAYRPNGSVAFSTDGAPVPGCSAVLLTTSGAAIASCSLGDAAPGAHAVVAAFAPYDPDAWEAPRFLGSTSAPLTITVPPASLDPSPAPPAGGLAPAGPIAGGHAGSTSRRVVMRRRAVAKPHRRRARARRARCHRPRHPARRRAHGARGQRCTTIRAHKHTRGAGR